LSKWLLGESVKVVVPKEPSASSGRRVYVLATVLLLVLVAGVGFLLTNPFKSSVQSQLDLARKFMQEENYSEALIQYRVALATDASNAEATAGARSAQEGLVRKQHEAEEKLKASVIDQFQEAEQEQMMAAEMAR